MTLKSIADQIGHQLGVPSVSMTFEEASAHFEDASEHFGITFLATMLAARVPVSSDLTRALPGWEPTQKPPKTCDSATTSPGRCLNRDTGGNVQRARSSRSERSRPVFRLP